jgi:TolB protein
VKAFAIITGKFEAGQLQLEVREVNSGKTTRFGFTADEQKFRHQVHELSDTIHKAFFGIPGIAATRILYTRKDRAANNDFTGDIWIADYDGKGVKKLTSQNALCVTPSFIPPVPGKLGKDYLYVCYKSGPPRIFHATTDGGNGQRILTMGGNQLMPELSRSRDKLAFVSDAAGNPDLFLQAFDPAKGTTGKARQIYSVPYATQASPTFSPDGSKIAFVSNKDGNPRIYLMDIPPEGMKQNQIKTELLVKRAGAATAPQWAPDGSKIAYTLNTEGVRQIWVYDLNTGENKQVTSGPYDKENPTWAPNALHLAYNLQKGDICDIYMLNINELRPIQLTKGPGEKKYPSWEKR